MPVKLKVVVPPHPLIAHWLTMLRNPVTPSPLYQKGFEELGRWLTYEALRDWLPYRKEEFETVRGKVTGNVIEFGIPLIAIASIPGGLELWTGGRDVLPNAKLCLGGIPDGIENNAGIILYSDQITTGELLLEKLDILVKQNVAAKRIRVICPIASSAGLKRIGELLPDLNIYCACIDDELFDKYEIIPGIGNTTERINTRIVYPN